jgi:hypothetical protein
MHIGQPPAWEKVPLGFFPCGGKIAKRILWHRFAILAAAAGDRTRKDTLTVSFHTILPSETFGLSGFPAGCSKPVGEKLPLGFFPCGAKLQNEKVGRVIAWPLLGAQREEAPLGCYFAEPDRSFGGLRRIRDRLPEIPTSLRSLE